MNSDTNQLRVFFSHEDLANLTSEGFEQIPPELENAAKVKLAGRTEATVSRNSGGKLSKWAAQRRKARRKMEKQTRRANR